MARAAQVLTILNPAPAQPLLTELLALVDLLVPNESEAALLKGIEVTDDVSAEQTVRQLQERGAHAVVITLGERGVGDQRRGAD